MSFKLKNPPVKIVAAAFQLENHPDFENIIKKSHDSLKAVLAGPYEPTESSNIKFNVQGSSAVSNITQHHYYSKEKKTVVSIKDDEIQIGTSTYSGFDEFAITISDFVKVFSQFGFPSVVGVSYRYANKLTGQLPSAFLEPEVQGPIWNGTHIHYDARTWIDLGDSRSVSIFVAATSPHAPQTSSIANLPRVQIDQEIEDESDGLNLDLIGTKSSCHLEMNSDLLVSELRTLREETKTVFSSISTAEGMAEWGVQNND